MIKGEQGKRSTKDEILEIAGIEGERVRARDLFEANKADIEAARAAGANWEDVRKWFEKKGVNISIGALRNVAWKASCKSKPQTKAPT